MEHEMNFWDLCVALGHAIGRGCAACGRVLARMVRLSYRYWWIVGTVVIVSLAAALYYTRQDNIAYKVNAVVLLNGPSIPQFEQALTPIRANKMVPPEAPIAPFLCSRKAYAFNTYRVIDCLHDGTADYIDFKHKSSPTDTVKVQMQDRLCLQFRIKNRDLALLPEIERALMVTLNSNPAMQQSYEVYIRNMREEVAFNHNQAHKLDSLTSAYYFYPVTDVQPVAYKGNGVNFFGDREVQLFLKDIYEQQQHLQQWDYRYQLATAPVSLENHFAVDPTPVNGRLKFTILFLMLGWIIGCGLAEMTDKRKAINAWLKA